MFKSYSQTRLAKPHLTPPIDEALMRPPRTHRDIRPSAFPNPGITGILSRIQEALDGPFSGASLSLAGALMARLMAILSLVFVFPATIYAQTGKLNDTGISTCANAASNNVPCGYADGDTYGYPRQEAEYGRAAKETAGQSLGKTGASDANSKGFDFSKVQYSNGAIPPAVTTLGTGTSWGCTKDNVTGLTWDMKVTTASNARLNTNTYNWKNSLAQSNGGISGVTGEASGTTCFSSACDTEAYIAYINTLNICGESTNDWRLPTRLELMSIVDASKQGTGNAAVDATYFPNIMPARYWTADNLAGNPNEARIVNMGSGIDGTAPKSSLLHVILVRP